MPRDRNGEFEPEIVKKHERRLPLFNEQIISLYSRGMTTRDIQSHLKEIYDVDVSPEEVLGFYLSDTEGAKFWMSVLTDLRNRGVQDILIACMDGLTGFPDAVRAVFPETRIQLCIVHMVRNSTKYVSYKDLRVIYTTNAIESLNYSLRKVTKNRSAFPDDDSIYKIMYLAIDKASQKWTQPIRNWGLALNQLSIVFGDRIKL